MELQGNVEKEVAGGSEVAASVGGNGSTWVGRGVPMRRVAVSRSGEGSEVVRVVRCALRV